MDPGEELCRTRLSIATTEDRKAGAFIKTPVSSLWRIAPRRLVLLPLQAKPACSWMASCGLEEGLEAAKQRGTQDVGHWQHAWNCPPPVSGNQLDSGNSA